MSHIKLIFLTNISHLKKNASDAGCIPTGMEGSTMKFKKLSALVMTGVLAVSMFAGCGSSSSSSASSDSSSEETASEDTSESSDTSSSGAEVKGLLEDGTLSVGMEIGYPPMEYFDEDGSTMIGFDVEMAQALADDMGVKLNIVDTAWDGIFAGVDTDKYDVIISTVSYTDDRNDNYTLTKPYIENAPVLVVPNDSDIADVTDLSGKSVAVQMETTADYIMQDEEKDGVDLTLNQYEKVINAFDELKAGRVDAVCTDSVVAQYYLGDEANNYKTVWQSPTKEPIVMCLKKGNDDLKASLETALDDIRANGKLGEIADKYFGTQDILPEE